MPAPETNAPNIEGSDIDPTSMCVADHMSSRIVAARADRSLGVAMERMLASGHRHVVVLDSQGNFEGLLSAEVITTSWMTGTGHRRQLVGDLIAVPPVHVSPEASMQTAASVMLSYSVDAVAVLEADGRLVGVLTWADIVAMVAARERA